MPGESPLPEGTTIGRVALRVTDREAMRAFYERVIGLETQETTAERTVMGAGDEPLLELIEQTDVPSRAAEETGLYHTAFLVPSRAALGDAVERIETQWGLEGTADHVVSEAVYLSDPEGNGIEVYRDRPRERWPISDDGSIGIDTIPLDLEAVRNTSRGAQSIPDETTIGHVHLEVSTLSATRSFYAGDVGMTITQRYDDSALFLAAGGYHHHLGVNVWGGRSMPPHGRGLAWFEIVVPDSRTLNRIRERLDQRGRDVVERSTGSNIETRDPDGIHCRFRMAEDE